MFTKTFFHSIVCTIYHVNVFFFNTLYIRIFIARIASNASNEVKKKEKKKYSSQGKCLVCVLIAFG